MKIFTKGLKTEVMEDPFDFSRKKNDWHSREGQLPDGTHYVIQENKAEGTYDGSPRSYITGKISLGFRRSGSYSFRMETHTRPSVARVMQALGATKRMKHYKFEITEEHPTAKRRAEGESHADNSDVLCDIVDKHYSPLTRTGKNIRIY